MKEIILITGAGGMIARQLAQRLDKDYTIRFLTRTKRDENQFEWDIHKKTIDEAALENVSHVIHLAGANIAEKKWTQKRKEELISSRIDSAQLILDTLKRKNIVLKSFISASGINVYGTETTEKIYKEEDPKGHDFLSQVVTLWEKAADRFLTEKRAERVVKLRTAVVLSDKEGALKKMIPPIRYYIGSPLGSGKQYMPWIHLNDICSIYEFALKNDHMNGAYNSSSPQHSTNENLTKKIAEVLKKPLFMPNIPSFVLKLIFGELSDPLLKGSRVSSQKLLDEGFRFEFPDLKDALEDLLIKKN
ncbi:TIGR01777 family oxidoreductase [Chryseobacterium sp. CT-SW4]|uniref:TIGR01777 family oxidoreductase n=1 Tax=Chryseobacterium sp. SW-1 TaxID=3157343 RepID=UPI003B01068D